MGHGFDVCQVDLAQIRYHRLQGGRAPTATATLAWWNKKMMFFARIVVLCAGCGRKRKDKGGKRTQSSQKLLPHCLHDYCAQPI